MRLIESILKTTAEATTGVKQYGRGMRAYANIEASAYPRIWVHTVNPIDEVHKNHSVTMRYQIIGEIADLVEYTADLANNEQSAEDYLGSLYNLEQIYLRFIGSLSRHPKNKMAIGQVTRKELLHEYDDNTIGYVFTFEYSINESIPYECP
jgi:hypothetical protein